MKKIQKVLVHELVSQEIQRYIEDHHLREGDKLPSVGEMTERFGVGRSSLREAIRYLEAIDVVRVENGKGVFVKDVGTFRFTGKVKLDTEKDFLLSILDVRIALEGKAVELASRRITAGQIDELRQCLAEYEALKESGQDTSMIDLSFHRQLIRASGNPILESVLQSISGLYEKFFQDPLGNKRLFDETYPFHLTMFEAVAAHDTEGALAEFRKMMTCIERIIKEY